ncbi:MAG: 16S rRNA (guanine(527)-N(7))-methyltransferase RsmG [Cypionkella sp.]|uniref:16S rRNA (guanine(527)-N(7))-methyltransferase RsmG n=1 Tax=Cypionkella sp. TaxID=2811411 RepID=UPI002ABC9EA4|nr:16S rRNA (guanine(527)-N(7))-methyltransferase RsmG [Cypionkella sp.]MDZ4312273.1 16S rRNA (guanine(527)-N(7))-methyltransferase RsmG [Cypionkella sp.]MDZ4391565.1 16S rRNA (guanine(527)-N(7))-methyltransferase RsmG [Cypionkella sp.]
MNRAEVVVPDWLNVSRETLERLFDYCELVEKWNPAINLVSKAGIADLWHRHLLDSAQLIQHIPFQGKLWCDLGSGGGFPGMVLAILAKELHPGTNMVLVESDRRKSVFLLEAARLLDVAVSVKTQRIEDLEPQNADVLTARALAPLSSLCDFAFRHLKPEGVAIFPKGAAAAREVQDAKQLWRFDLEQAQSHTDPAALVLALRGIRHA